MINQYISELLYDHNCVIIPGFGGFVANRLPSKVNDLQQRVEPARKVVAYNINLTQNDGLLASHISNGQNISFDAANELVREYVTQLKSEIELKRHSSLKGIGDFYLNTENKYVFIPEADINFAKETYGLFPITIRKIQRENEELREEAENKRSLPLPITRTAVKRSHKWVYGTILITLPLVFGVFTQQSGILQKADFNINNIFKKNAVTPTEEKIAEPIKETVMPVEQYNLEQPMFDVPMFKQPEVEQPKVDMPKMEEQIIPETTKEVIPEAPKTEAVVVPEKVTIATSKNETVAAPAPVTAAIHYHIIGGSFKLPTNANNFIKQLQDKGYKAYNAGLNAAGLTMISYGGFTTEAEALQFIQKIHQSENAQAWLLNK
jgi:cell division septation protein DedD